MTCSKHCSKHYSNILQLSLEEEKEIGPVNAGRAVIVLHFLMVETDSLQKIKITQLIIVLSATECQGEERLKSRR